jgi:pyruvate, orthophosphate dikinase
MVVTATKTKWVYLFREGSGDQKDLLGGKGAGVAEMTRAGMPVPPGFTISTEACRQYYADGKKFPEGLWDQAQAALKDVEKATGKGFGDASNPLLVSVRSGAKFSMPGMMDTVLNLGLNPDTLGGLQRLTGDERFALDAYRRFVQMFGKIVKGIEGDLFEEALSGAKKLAGVKTDPELDPAHLREVVEVFKGIYRKHTGEDFPDDPLKQLRAAIEAVFSSWNTDRAVAYRRAEKIPDDLGTAVNVQTMVFGNMGDDSGTGVAFTRNPITGAKELYGDYLANAQGEDVVAGIRDTEPISALKRRMPDVYKQFTDYAEKLEAHYKDVQDLEFTIERGKLYMLQTRNAKRTGEAAVRLAIAMEKEGLISRQEAVARVEPRQLEQLLHPRVDPNAKEKPIGKGVPASPGAATGLAVFDADTAEEWGKDGKAVILVRVETNPSDVHGMIAARGILTSTGGTASHAALVARGMGRPCIVGANEIEVDLRERRFSSNGATIKQGEEITIDGTTGNVFAGKVTTIEPKPSADFKLLLGWADAIRRLQVWANGDYPRDAEKARELGAQGIGLCRTEHMFMEEERLPIVQSMILSESTEEREKYLAELLPLQRSDFEGILRAMKGLPVVIRLIDPPLHEFLPNREDLVRQTTELRITKKKPKKLKKLEKLLARVELPRDHPDAGAGDHGGRLRPEEEGRRRAARDHDPAGRPHQRAALGQGGAGAGRQEGPGGEGRQGPLQVRDHDRGAPRGADRRRDRDRRRVLQLRHQRPDPDHLRLLPRRRRGQVHRPVPGAEDPAPQPLRDHRLGRRGAPHGPGRQGGPRDPQEPRGGDLRRARRRPRVDQDLPRPGPRLRLLQPLPSACGKARGGPGGDHREGRLDGLAEPPRESAGLYRQSLGAIARVLRDACGGNL